jgi:hypothetical protein
LTASTRLPDLRAADVNPVAGGVIVGPVGLGDDAHAFRLDAQGDDLALQLGAGLLEGTNVSHVNSPFCFRARDHRGLDGDQVPEAIGDASACGPQRSGGRRAKNFLVPRGMGGSPRGRKFGARRCGQTIEAKPPFGQIKP